MKSRKHTTLLLGLVGSSLIGFAGPGGAAGKRTSVVSTTTKGPVAASPTKPDEDEIVEVSSTDSKQGKPGQADLNAPGYGAASAGLQGRLDQLDQQNAELTNKLQDLERRLDIVANPPTSVRLTGYIDFGFFAFMRGTGSGITNYLPQPATKYSDIQDAAQRQEKFRNDERVQRFPEFFAPCGFADNNAVNPCPLAPASGLNQVRWRFLGDPLATAINSAGHPADVRAQNNPSQSSLAVPYDYIQSGGRPTFIINELNLMPIAKLDPIKGLSAMASINFYPRTASVSVGDKNDGGSVVAAGPTRIGDYMWVDMAFLEYATRFQDGKHQLSIFAGRFDPNIGIEYRVRKSPDRFGVTPSLICRYSCGTPIGLKMRGQFFDELFSVALAVHNSASYQEIFRFSENTDKKYMKTISGRVSVHCNEKNYCQKVNVELGLSGEFGGQADGFYNVGISEFDPFVKQWTVDVDLHVEYRGLEVRAEFLKSQADGFYGSDTKPSLPRLAVQGFYFEGSYKLLNWLGVMARWDVRDAVHIDYTVPFAYSSLLWRITAAARFDINDNIAFKAEFVHLQPFGRMKEGLEDNAAVGLMNNPLSGTTAAGEFAADYVTTSLVLRY